jgi:hypothetical protein
MNHQHSIIQARREFFWDTINFYRADLNRRAVEFGSCKYRTSDGRSCAIGRYLTDKQAVAAQKVKFSINTMSEQQYKEIIPYKLRRLGKKFLIAMQEWHDCACGDSMEGVISKEIFDKFCV